MSKLLYIKANIKPEGESKTFEVADKFIEDYKKANPNDEVEVLDLYKEDIDFLRPEDLGKLYGPKDENSKNDSLLKYVYQFAEADKYVFAAPMWNLSVPAILKAYIDYVSVAGITFKYTSDGVVGLLEGKKAVHVVSRGGVYANSPVEMGDRYLRTVLGLYGIQDVKTIALDGLNQSSTDVEATINAAIEEGREIIKNF